MDYNKKGYYPIALVNVTNRCNLKCKHCFVFRNENPNDASDEMETEEMLKRLKSLQAEYGIEQMLWMGGEPMLRPDVLKKGIKFFEINRIVTNGQFDLIDLPGCIYVISVDGPPELNDEIRGKGVFNKVLKTLSRIPDKFGSKVTCQCVVTKKNQDSLEELVEYIRPTRAEGMVFTFYVPPKNDKSDQKWESLKKRDIAVNKIFQLKEKYPDFILNSYRTLELMLSENSKNVTDNCPLKKYALPLYLEGDKFVRPYCCYGNDVDCDLCGAWPVFYVASKIESFELIN
ncbi:MAG: radical SAM protein [Deltaproteobacteria bacterium]|nr:radical SAM protein [Deltaproteobacteria bacterium]